ncbi:hypothetical protein TM239_20390 [Bradyrhizobium sp. TM239]|nr:hypothetical protein TM239_20390 [Bradyrhizobium sp. TM239]
MPTNAAMTLAAAATICAGLPPVFRPCFWSRRRWRNLQGMRWRRQTVCRSIVPKRIGIKTLASIDGVARIGGGNGCRR